VLLTLPITVFEAYNGAKIDVPTPNASVSMRIPPFSQSGQKMRLRGKGVAGNKCRAAGDLIVTLEVKLPGHESSKLSDLLKEVQENYITDVRAKLK